MYKITEKDIDYCDALCHKFYRQNYREPTEDQIQDAREYMCRAAQKYKPEMGRFMSYAGRWIWGSVMNNLVVKHVSKQRNNKIYNRSNDAYRCNRINHCGTINDLDYIPVFYDWAIGDPESYVLNKDEIKKLYDTMPPVVQIAFLSKALDAGRGVVGKMSDAHNKYKLGTRQAIDEAVQRWRGQHGIKSRYKTSTKLEPYYGDTDA